MLYLLRIILKGNSGDFRVEVAPDFDSVIQGDGWPATGTQLQRLGHALEPYAISEDEEGNTLYNYRGVNGVVSLFVKDTVTEILRYIN